LAAIVVIPARYGSTRFPAKILASETGKPLVQHVVERAQQAKRVSEVIVATDDARIVDALKRYGTRTVMTDSGHLSGTDRIAEVARRIGPGLYINVQGDEPEIEPETIDQLAYDIVDGGHAMQTVATPFRPPADPADPNLVKIVFSRQRRAIYFSRSLIPFQRDPASAPPPTYYLHVGIYAYGQETLLRLAGWKPTPAELSEKLEQLRALEHDVSMGVTVVERATHGIDTPEQYAAFVKRERGVGS
jgi:3-deoxy-manno-octulosonate cytidylyltransferase (CMP-KDO synthetase)